MRFLLLQVRDVDDPMRGQEVNCFARSLGVGAERIAVFDLLTEAFEARHLEIADVYLFGGSGAYSAAADPDENPWLARALEAMRTLHASGRPAFASCWGFQAMARALGGRVINDPDRWELGTIPLTLTDAGRDDPVFGPLGSPFDGHAGHEDTVVELPPNATLLASSERVVNQAFRFDDAPIYCTQFHPELTVLDLKQRVRRYPKYAEEVAGVTIEEFERMIHETPETRELLPRFVEWVRKA